nr:MAG TPA: hypothetical protein [Caudoviricetes sp.]
MKGNNKDSKFAPYNHRFYASETDRVSEDIGVPG